MGDFASEKTLPESIGIIAGSGQFPFLVARGARARGLKVFICGFENNADPALAGEADAFVMLNLGKLGGLIKFFKKNKVRHLCMAGAVSKPRALDIRPDFRATLLMMKLSRNKGDDAILRAVTEALESEGMTVLPPDRLVPGLRGNPSGVLSKRQPNREEWADLLFGWKVVKAVGGLDIGQAVAVRSGIVVAVEAIEGTDSMLRRAGDLGGAGCSLIKAAKPGQEDRVDLPSLGDKTLKLMAENQFSALAFEADKTLFFDFAGAMDIADAAGITVVGVPADAESFFAEYARLP